MTTAREDARDVVGDALPPSQRSAVRGIRGLRWWVVVLVAALFAVGGVAGDLVRAGELGIVYTVCFPVGAILAAVWVRRGELFATCVQPPLLLALGVPLALAITGSWPRTGGLTGALLAVGGPMINGFPVMAVTTAICLAVAFVRTRLQPLGIDADRDERDGERDRDRDRAAARPPRPDDRRPDDRRPDDRRPDDRRPDDRRPERPRDRGAAPARPAPTRHPGEPAARRAPSRRSRGVPRPPPAADLAARRAAGPRRVAPRETTRPAAARRPVAPTPRRRASCARPRTNGTLRHVV